MKKLFNIVLLAMGCITAFAQVVESNNKVYIKDFTIAPGEEKTLEIILDNPDAPVSSLQFDIAFPQPTNPNYGGLELVEGSLAKVSDRISRSSHSIRIDKQWGEGIYRVGVLSTSSKFSNSAIAGKNGAILTLKVKAAINYKGGKIRIDEVVASDATCAINPEPYEIDIQPESETKAGVFVGTASVSTDMQLLRNLTPTQIGVSLNNIIEVTGFQAKITLPDGVNFCEDEDGEFITTVSDRLSGNIVPSVNNVPGEPNSYILVISSLTSDKFIGDEGEIFKLNLVSNKDFEQGDVLISDITVSSAPGYSYDVNIGETMAVTLKAVSDPSGDGAWDIDDVDSIIDLYLFDEYNSINDLNADGVVDIDDVDIAIDNYLNF